MEEEFVVIGAGWGRTGTMSLKTALEMLNIKTYHMEECFKHRDANFWTNLSIKNHVPNNDITKNPFFNVFGKRGFRAAVDFPAASYYKTLMKAYPNAKVILTVRDSNEWYKSCEDTIFTTMPDYPGTSSGVRIIFGLNIPGVGFTQMFHKTMTEDAFSITEGEWDKSRIIKAYEAHNEEVMKEVPSDRLLVLDFSKGDGRWDKLCPFLNLSVPNGTPFPKVNYRSSFQFNIKVYSVLGVMLGCLLLGIPFLFQAQSLIQGDKKKQKQMIQENLL